jgi:hypothetical protein
MLKIDTNNYGIQLKDNPYIIWKHGRRSDWRLFSDYSPCDDLVTTKLMISWKEKRKKLSVLINLIKSLSLNRKWKLKRDAIFNLINKNNFEEIFLWMKYVRTKEKQRTKLKKFFVGKIFKFNYEENSIEDIWRNEKIFSRCVIELKIRCSLKYERRKKFRFKFKLSGNEKCNQWEMFNKFIKVSKEVIGKEKRTRLKSLQTE